MQVLGRWKEEALKGGKESWGVPGRTAGWAARASHTALLARHTASSLLFPQVFHLALLRATSICLTSIAGPEPSTRHALWRAKHIGKGNSNMEWT